MIQTLLNFGTPCFIEIIEETKPSLADAMIDKTYNLACCLGVYMSCLGKGKLENKNSTFQFRSISNLVYTVGDKVD